MREIEQGMLLKAGGISHPVIVVSRNELNQTGEVLACPILNSVSPSALHKPISFLREGKELSGYVACEHVRHLDLNTRHFSVLGQISLFDLMDISDTMVSLFEYL